MGEKTKTLRFENGIAGVSSRKEGREGVSIFEEPEKGTGPDSMFTEGSLGRPGRPL